MSRNIGLIHLTEFRNYQFLLPVLRSDCYLEALTNRCLKGKNSFAREHLYKNVLSSLSRRVYSERKEFAPKEQILSLLE